AGQRGAAAPGRSRRGPRSRRDRGARASRDRTAEPISDYHQRMLPDEQVEEVRRFNRTVTQRVGALSDRFLARDRPLGEARVLWEIGPEGCEVRTLRNRLCLDYGHASRLLRALEADGLIVVGASPADGRVRTARLTAAGRRE